MSTDATFGNQAVPVGSSGDARKPVPSDAVPMRGVLGRPENGGPDAVLPSWVQHGVRRDHGLCVRCARSGGKGRKVAGKNLCAPHIMQDNRKAVKAAKVTADGDE